MSVRHRKSRPPKFLFDVGQFVFSKAIGRMDGFTGEVVERFTADTGRSVFYHVKHPDGSLWHRVHDDLKLAEQAIAA